MEQTGKPRQRRTETVLVRAQGLAYADLLKKVKGQIHPEQINVQVSQVRKTRNGDLAISVQSGDKQAEKLKDEITRRMADVRASTRNDGTVLRIREIEPTSSKRDITTALGETTGLEEGAFRVISLRPARGESQTATVVAPEGAAKNLVDGRFVKVGQGSLQD